MLDIQLFSNTVEQQKGIESSKPTDQVQKTNLNQRKIFIYTKLFFIQTRKFFICIA